MCITAWKSPLNANHTSGLNDNDAVDIKQLQFITSSSSNISRFVINE